MRRLVCLAVAALWCAAVPAAFAYPERVEEIWRSPAGALEGPLLVDPSDGSCWVRDPQDYWATLVHVSSQGQELGRRPIPAGLEQPVVLPLRFSATDHTWWAQDRSALVHFAEDGSALWRQTGVILGWPMGFEISPLDGSLWLASSGLPPGDALNDVPPHSRLVHLSADGTVLSSADYGTYFLGLALTAGGGCWVVSQDDAFTRTFLRFSPAGEPAAERPLPAGLSGTVLPSPGLSIVPSLQLNPADGSLYATAHWAGHGPPLADTVFRMAANGTLLWQLTGFYNVASVALVPGDGSLWIADQGVWASDGSDLLLHSQVAHLDANGQYLWRGDAFSGPRDLQINSYDGTVWLDDSHNRQMVHLRVIPPPFPDIAGDSWAYDAIAACAAAGIVQGYWNGYHPDEVVTRDQMAVYVSRALVGSDAGVQVPSGLAEPTFSDVDEEHWAYRYIEYCVGANIVEGYPDGGYHPGEAVNRGQMAVYIARSQVTPSGDTALPDPPDEPTFTDVTAENDWAWCYPHVEYCAAEAIVQGYWDGYHPERPVTRDQMAVYVARAFDLAM